MSSLPPLPHSRTKDSHSIGRDHPTLFRIVRGFFYVPQNYHLNFGDQTEVSVFLWKSPCAGSSKASTAENIISLFLRCHFSSVHQTLRYLNGYPKDPTPVGTRQTPGINTISRTSFSFVWKFMKVQEQKIKYGDSMFASTYWLFTFFSFVSWVSMSALETTESTSSWLSRVTF